MKKIIAISIWLCFITASVLAQDLGVQLRRMFVTEKANYIGKTVAELLQAWPLPVNSFVVVPNYNIPDYGNEFRFSNQDLNTTSSIIDKNAVIGDSGNLYMLYVKFYPQIKYPTTGFIKDNKGKAIVNTQYEEFSKYKVVDIRFSAFPR